jgi:hypothetical protein
MLDNLTLSIKDLDKDGFYELLLPKALSSYRGAGAIPVWISIYRWEDQKFKRADSNYPKYYKEQLPSLEFKIEQLTKKFTSENLKAADDTRAELRSHYDRLLAVKAILRDKILRLTGDNSKAGFNEALEWSKSSDSEMRENAVIVFGDIFDRQSRTQLELLIKDRDQGISGLAQWAIRNGSKQDQ